MTKTFDIAVVGATGVVGEAMLASLAERKFPVGKIHALASERSAGNKVAYGNREIVVKDLADFDFSIQSWPDAGFIVMRVLKKSKKK